MCGAAAGRTTRCGLLPSLRPCCGRRAEPHCPLLYHTLVVSTSIRAKARFATPCGDVWACGDMNYDVIAESKCRGAYYDARAQYRYRQTSHVTPVRCLSDSHLSLDSLESRHKSLVSRSLMSHVSHTLTTPPSPKCAHSHFCVLHRRDEQTTPHTRCQRLRRATARRARGQSRRFRSRSAPMRLLRGW